MKSKKNFRKAIRLVTTFEGIFALVFGALFIWAFISVAKGAWWHIFTAVVSYILCHMLISDMKRLHDEEEQYYNQDLP